MEPRIHRISDFIDLHQILRAYRNHGGVGWLFRGQAKAEWPLVPKAGRAEWNNGRDLGRFNDWRSYAVAYGDLPANSWEALAVAQHHGLATRLLDWTLNPLVATFFAVLEEFNADGALYCYMPGGYVREDAIEPADCSFVCGYLPRAINRRLVSQSGAFTVHPEPSVPLAVGPQPEGLVGPNLAQIIIPAESKRSILQGLDDYGVNHRALFPDLDGLSRYVNWYTAEMVRKSDGRESGGP